MTIHLLTTEQVAWIYHAHMQHDFAPDEMKPLQDILRLMQEGLYKGYGLWENGDLRGYALFMTAPGGRVALLDYYAVIAGHRGGGWGSRFLALLQKELAAYDGMVLESEHIAYAVGRADNAIRRRRIAFYLRNGLRMTSLQSRLFGVDFSILYMPCGRDLSDGQLYCELNAIYQRLFPAYLWQKKVELSMRQG